MNKRILKDRIELHLENAHTEGKHEDVIEEDCPLCESRDVRERNAEGDN